MTNQLEIVLATNRPLVGHLFAAVSEHPVALDVTCIPVDIQSVDFLHRLVTAALVVIDVAPDLSSAVQMCDLIRNTFPNLPIVGLVCCARAVSPEYLRALIASHMHSVVDLHATTEQLIDTIRRTVRGETVVHVHLDRGQGAFLSFLTNSQAGSGRFASVDTQVLSMVTLGLTDCEIGERLCLSPHTIKRYIERLRDDIGARHRTELAAWAGMNGFYSPNCDQPA